MHMCTHGFRLFQLWERKLKETNVTQTTANPNPIPVPSSATSLSRRAGMEIFGHTG